ncbi:hypothetical protein [Parasutterella secunda]|uniref:hypothetical protein n=1 Tax=Parasutterella secunda TaxID=626947 RepID=UPI0025A46C52|nr:hypothetical protein [Parasutterella secunda]MDM8226364.1 hypothetical protein [Parasutterella secunda]
MTQMSLFSEDEKQEDFGDLVFCWFFRHWRTGKIIRAKGRPFCFPARTRKR